MQRYERLHRRWIVLRTPYEILTSYVTYAVVRKDVWDESVQRAVERDVLEPVINNAALWKNFRSYWQLPSSVTFEHLAIGMGESAPLPSPCTQLTL